MAEFSIQDKQKIESFRKAYPELCRGLSDAEILTAFNSEYADIQLSEDLQNSIMSGFENQSLGLSGLKIENTFALDEEQEAQLKAVLEQRITSLNAKVKEAEKNSSVVGKVWSWAKNNVPFLDEITDSSNEVRVQAQKELQILKSKNINEAFSELTGLEYNAENVNKFLNSQEDSEIKLKSEQALEAYKSGQESSADFVSDMIAAAGSMVIYSAAVAAVLVGGAPIGLAAIVGLTGAGVLGAGVKVGVKALDAATGGKEYKPSGKDFLFGALNGFLAPITAGFGGKIASSAVTRLGGTFVKEGGELLVARGTNSLASGGFKKFAQEALLNPMGNFYKGSNAVKATGCTIELGFDGGISGSIDAGARTAYDGGSATDIAQSALFGGVGGALGSIGLGSIFKFKYSGNKAHQKGAEFGEKARNYAEEQSILEGHTQADDLTEIAPFAKEMENGDKTLNETLDVADGEFINGKFVPNGVVTRYYNPDNPLNNRSRSWKQTTPSFKIAQNKTELKKQIANILGVDKIDDYFIKEIDKFLKNNPNVTISDLSEILGNLHCINYAKDFLTGNKLQRITNIERFKTNTGYYAEFLSSLDSKYGATSHCKASSRVRFDNLVNFLEQIDSPSFKLNCDSYLKLSNIFADEINPKDYLVTVHNEAFFERIRFLDHFNVNIQKDLSGNIQLFTKLDMLTDDKKYSELLERMEYCDKASKYSLYEADQVLQNGGESLEKIKIFEASIPDGIKKEIYDYYMDILHNSPENIDKFIEFSNSCPEGWIKLLFDNKYGPKQYSRERADLFASFGANCGEDGWLKDINGNMIKYEATTRTPDEILKRVELLKKFTERSDINLTPNDINRMLCSHDIKDVDKAILFLDIADENYIKSLKIYNNDKNGILNIINLNSFDDNFIENCKRFNELPENIRKKLIENRLVNFGSLSFKTQIDIIKKYQDKIDIELLIYLLQNDLQPNIKNFDRKFSLLEVLKKEKEWQELFSALSDADLMVLSDQAFDNLVKAISITKVSEFANSPGSIFYNLNTNKEFYEELSPEELAMVLPRLCNNLSDIVEIKEIKRRIALIPEKIRPYLRGVAKLAQSYSFWFDSKQTEKNIITKMQQLDKFNEKELNILGNRIIRGLINGNTVNDINIEALQTKINLLSELPTDALEILKRNPNNVLHLLESDSEINVQNITERYNLLVKISLENSIDTSSFFRLIQLDEDRYSVVKSILESPNKKIESINNLINALPSREIVQKHKDFIFDVLINNPNNRAEDISTQLNYIYNRNVFEVTGPEEIEFTQSVVQNFIEKGVFDYYKDNKSHVYNILNGIKIKKNNNLAIEKAKYESFIKLFSNPEYRDSYIIDVYYSIKNSFYEKQIELLEKMLYEVKLDFYIITSICSNWNNYGQVKILDKYIHDNALLNEEYLVKILESVNESNSLLAEKLFLNDHNEFSVDQKLEILEYAKIDKIQDLDKYILDIYYGVKRSCPIKIACEYARYGNMLKTMEIRENIMKHSKILKQHGIESDEKAIDKMLTTPVNTAIGSYDGGIETYGLDGVNELLKITDMATIENATQLKFTGFKNFLLYGSLLSRLSPDNYAKLKEVFAKFPYPEQKVQKIQIITSLIGNISDTELTTLINKIETPNVSAEQKFAIEKIFSPENPKTYSEKIDDFIKEFNVPEAKVNNIRNWLLSAKLDTKFIEPKPIEEQINDINRRISNNERIINSGKIPEEKLEKMRASNDALLAQKEDMIANPEKYTKIQINDKAMQDIENKVRDNINYPNQTKAFIEDTCKLLYAKMGIQNPTEDLLNAINYDFKYFARIFAGLDNPGWHSSDGYTFRTEFTKLINLLIENPGKKLTEARMSVPENQITKKMFEENGLDFEFWNKFDENFKYKFSTLIKKDQAVAEVLNNLKEELKTDMFKLFDKKERELLLNKIKTAVESMHQTDNPVENNLLEANTILSTIENELKENEYWKQNAGMFSDHIKDHRKKIQDAKDIKDREISLFVRLSDSDDIGRNIFFGDHVGCCTSCGGGNGFAASQHLQNAFVRGYELVDENGISYGNSMCFFAKIDGKLTFVIDSFEANGQLAASQEVPDALITFAHMVCEREGRPDAQIMFGPNYNHIASNRFKQKKEHSIEIVGAAPCDTYIDSMEGFGDINEPCKTLMIEIKE